MHQTEGVPHLVCHDVAQHRTEDGDLVVEPAGRGVGSRRLAESPVVHQLEHVVVEVYRGLEDLTGAGVGPGGSHRIGLLRGGVDEAGVADVVGVKARVILRIALGDDGVLEADGLKCLLPVLDALLEVGVPLFGECVIDVVDDWLGGDDEFASLMPLDILGLWLQAPAIDVLHLLHRQGVGGDLGGSIGEVANTVVVQAGAHHILVVRQQSERGVDHSGEGLLIHGVDGADGHVEITREGADVSDGGEVLLEAPAQLIGSEEGVKGGLGEEGCDRGLVGEEERRGVDDHSGGVGAPGGDLEGTQHRHQVIVLHPLVDRGLGVSGDGGIELVEVEALIVL